MNKNNNLREWRLAKGMTLQELSLKTGLKHKYLLQLEEGLRQGTPNTWIKLAQVLKISAQKLFDEDVKEAPYTAKGT